MSGKDETYLVWSHEHGAWWGPGRHGYVPDIKQAGRYSRADALEICVDAMRGRPPDEPPYEIPVREADMEAVYRAHEIKIR